MILSSNLLLFIIGYKKKRLFSMMQILVIHIPRGGSIQYTFIALFKGGGQGGNPTHHSGNFRENGLKRGMRECMSKSIAGVKDCFTFLQKISRNIIMLKKSAKFITKKPG